MTGRGEDGEWEGTLTQASVENIVLSAEDHEWLVERYGRHPRVLSVWEAACHRTVARAA